MKLALGPVPYYWDRETLYDFYKSIQDAPLDIVYLGEVVCSKRRTMRLPDWLQIGEELASAGKEVVLSTLALIEAESELATLRKICANKRFLVEANDMAAVYSLSKLRQSFIGGPHLNIYNAEALAMLAFSGARRWTMPVEMAADTLAAIQSRRPEDIETEVFIMGRLPLAFSARCFTARAHGHSKDNCDFVCAQYPDGLPMYTQDNEPFLVLNGIQTQSASIYSLISHLEELEEMGVDVVRISPPLNNMVPIIECLHSALNDTRLAGEAAAEIHQHLSHPVNNSYWRGSPGVGGR